MGARECWGSILDVKGAIDVLISTTPGQLIDHLEKTPEFSLQHLRFCRVIDEADLVGSQTQG